MLEVVKKILLTCTKIRPENIFEIGARFGEHAEYLANEFDVPFENVYVFEPHPAWYEIIRKKYPEFNALNYAISNFDGETEFNFIRVDDLNSLSIDMCGISSLRKHYGFNEGAFFKAPVQCRKMKTVLEALNIDKIDFLKLDVEGCTYEVLAGFEDRISSISSIRSIHLEGEHKQYWEGQKLYEDIEKFMLENDFVQAGFLRLFSQSDSIWVRKEDWNF